MFMFYVSELTEDSELMTWQIVFNACATNDTFWLFIQ